MLTFEKKPFVSAHYRFNENNQIQEAKYHPLRKRPVGAKNRRIACIENSSKRSMRSLMKEIMHSDIES
jgi:hypothetical protein